MSEISAPEERLPDRPVSPIRVYELMQPPRNGIGFASPHTYTEEFGVEEGCTSGFIEYRGDIKLLYYDTDTGWGVFENTINDVDSFFHGDMVMKNKFIKPYENSLPKDNMQKEYPKPYIEPSPPGYISKVRLRHFPLSPPEVQEINMSPDIEEVYPIYTNENGNCVGIIIVEKTQSKMNNHVFLYYDSTIGTWRIVDSTNGKHSKETVNHIIQEVEEKLSNTYNSQDVNESHDEVFDSDVETIVLD